MKEYAILLDTTNCTGCNTCMYKCTQENRLQEPPSRGLFRTWVEINDRGLVHHRCLHCLDPACVAACKESLGENSALTRSGYGPVLYDAALCQGCGACVESCPFEVPRLDEAAEKIVKCSMCAHRLAAGKPPACVEACPTNALIFGEYKQILSRAQKTAAEQRLHLYGQRENGGGHFLVLTREIPEAAGYPRVAFRAEKLDPVPAGVGVAAVAAAALSGLKAFSDRRARIEKETKP